MEVLSHWILVSKSSQQRAFFFFFGRGFLCINNHREHMIFKLCCNKPAIIQFSDNLVLRKWSWMKKIKFCFKGIWIHDQEEFIGCLGQFNKWIQYSKNLIVPWYLVKDKIFTELHYVNLWPYTCLLLAFHEKCWIMMGSLGTSSRDIISMLRTLISCASISWTSVFGILKCLCWFCSS